MKPTFEQIETLKELINIGVGWAAAVLNDMIDAHIILSIPMLKIVSLEDIKQEIDACIHQDKMATVRLNFTGSLDGNAQLVFSKDSASKLIAIITNEQPDSLDLDSVTIGTLTEIGNILINGVMGSMSNIIHQQFIYSLPTYIEASSEELLLPDNFGKNITILLAQTRFMIEQLHIEGEFILMFKLGSFELLLKALDQEMC